MKPEYLHVLLNPLPVYGMVMGLLTLGLAMLFRSRAARHIALMLLLLVCVSIPVIKHFGEEGYDRVYSMSYQEGQAWLDAHKERAEVLQWVYYVTAVALVVGLLIPLKFPRSYTPLNVLILLLGAASLFAGMYISKAGGEIRHSEFRNGPPPTTSP